jgi:hypothetical protein
VADKVAIACSSMLHSALSGALGAIAQPHANFAAAFGLKTDAYAQHSEIWACVRPGNQEQVSSGK